MLEEGANLIIHDPKVDKSQIKEELERVFNSKDNIYKVNYDSSNIGKWDTTSNLEKAFSNSDAVLIITEWNEYKNIDWHQVYREMRSPSWVFDARSIVDPKKVLEAGLNLWRIGDGS